MFRVIETIERRISRLNLLMITVGISFLVLGMFLNTGNIGGRYLFRAPIRSTYELTGLFMVILIALGWPHTTEIKGHVSVDILTTRLPDSIRKVLDIITLFIGLVSFIVLGYSFILTGIQFHQVGNQTDLLRIPYMPIAMLMAIGAFLAAIMIFFQLVRALRIISRG
jgi:TRAP-type C4-dicarboxylate transport system permease small subunit